MPASIPSTPWCAPWSPKTVLPRWRQQPCKTRCARRRPTRTPPTPAGRRVRCRGCPSPSKTVLPPRARAPSAVLHHWRSMCPRLTQPPWPDPGGCDGAARVPRNLRRAHRMGCLWPRGGRRNQAGAARHGTPGSGHGGQTAGLPHGGPRHATDPRHRTGHGAGHAAIQPRVEPTRPADGRARQFFDRMGCFAVPGGRHHDLPGTPAWPVAGLALAERGAAPGPPPGGHAGHDRAVFPHGPSRGQPTCGGVRRLARGLAGGGCALGRTPLAGRCHPA